MDPQALGRYLRESREAAELRLDDAVQRLRIRRHILESFEQGDFDVADTPVRVRGMLRNYARFLGLDEDKVLGFYEASQTDPKPQKRGWFGFGRKDSEPENPVAPKRITDTPPALPKVESKLNANAGTSGTMQRLNTLLKNVAMLLVSVAALAVIGFVIMQTVNPPQPDRTTAQGITPTLSGSATVTLTPIFTSTPAPTEADNAVNFSDFSGVNVELVMDGRSWMRVWVDENETFVGILEPGDTQQFTGDNRVRLIAANAAALQITFNGDDQGTLGARGQQVEVTFDTSGVSVDVQSAGEQPTFTPLPTGTPTPTLLPGFPTPTPPPATATPLAMPTDNTNTSPASSPTWTPDAPPDTSDTSQGASGDPDIGGSNPTAQAADNTAASNISPPGNPTLTPLPLGNNPVQVPSDPTATPGNTSQSAGLPPAPVDPVNPAASATAAMSATPSPTMTATLTLTPAGTPTATPVLPIRATPADRPPTKQP